MSSIIEQRLPNRPSVASSPDTTAPLLAVSNVSKSFPGVVALSGVDLALRGGEIHALLGENGAGKSTLIRVITGAQYPDEGELVIEGRSVQIASPRVARQFGIGVVPQEVLFVPGLSIGRNMLLGFDKPLVRRSHLSETEHAVVSKALDQVGARFAPTAIASTLSVPDLRLAQIARTLIQPGNIIILDEPTAVLSEPDAERLLEKLLSLRDLGKGIIYITHRLSEVMKIADRATVLRDGRCVALFDRPEFDRAKMVEAMARLDKDAEQARERAVDARRDANEAREVMLNVQG
jgi:ribose transport system ATP-binding protein